MRLELTQPNGHYPLKVACLPISPPPHSRYWAKNGTRTRDPDLGKVVLYQLSYFREKRCVRDSNPWPHAWQACILTSWTNAPCYVHPQRLELWTHWLRVSCSTNWATDAFRKIINFLCYLIKYPTEFQRPSFRIAWTWAKNGTRTRDPDLGKVVLYQLSYFRVLLLCSTSLEVLRVQR